MDVPKLLLLACYSMYNVHHYQQPGIPRVKSAFRATSVAQNADLKLEIMDSSPGEIQVLSRCMF